MPDIIEWPRAWWGVVSAEFYLMPKSQRSSSPWTMRQNIYGPHVQYWQCSLAFPTLSDAALATREAIVESLGGSVGLLRMGHPFRKGPMFNDDVTATTAQWSDGTYFENGSGWASGTLPPVIHVTEAAERGARSVVVGGLPANTSRAMRRGDLVEFRVNGIADETPRLHRLRTDGASNASGELRIQIMPPLRKGLAAGDTVVLDYPTSVFRLIGDDQGFASRNLAWNGNFKLDLIEALI